ncbi:hypothetical protein [Methylotuvimicrobium alcaliphilum]|uniref:Transmembrane protein n=1 Tax=Methylotuvimicrobium alcaliphilum (strain DSM 19304 / NCIMB 14124 / VKM B-2133 / 20Z) TaxID=1091494 RepID=G4ST36_META2|nr:hypothetical protein [Methylotuvimicrobium alcaliphilum]CCE22746.1 exported protein of unknown function [Methylotuvimicrobium alcaliphilum 20Z]
MLTPQKRDFIEKRRRLTRYWPIGAGLLLASLAALSVWLWNFSPYLANPYCVIERLESGKIDAGMMAMSTLLLPMMTLTVIVLLGLAVVMGFASFANEKKYQAIINKLINDKD